MSYSFGIPADRPAEELRERLEEAAANAKAAERPEEVDRDIAAAINAAVTLAQSLCEGDGLVDVGATISGHANADRDPPPGWSPDSVHVSVTRAWAPASVEHP